MKNQLLYKKTLLVVVFVMFGLILLHASPVAAAIGKITGFKGDAIIQSGAAIAKVTKAGMPLNDGDLVATQSGEVNITFNDGAVMKVNSYSNIQLQERTEQSGTWIFKTSQSARRITCMVGKLWYKTGASNTKSYLQSPTAVAGLRGSDGDFGYDNVRTYLNMYSGDAAVIGSVIRGFFDNPGISAAQKSSVYQSMQRAYQQTVQAQEAPPTVLKPVVQAQAKIAALDVAQQVAAIMKSNPDAVVASQASQALVTLGTITATVRTDLGKAIGDAQKAGVTVPTTTVPATTTTVPAPTTAPTTAASTTSTSTTSTTSTTSSMSTTTICPSPPCEPKQ
ncbi:MAG: FecR domain-containing protein [Deltaproteobacteria bacterium]|nr:FecR domain-containing protein [Deltaproteobacteria bacterium]